MCIEQGGGGLSFYFFKQLCSAGTKRRKLCVRHCSALDPVWEESNFQPYSSEFSREEFKHMMQGNCLKCNVLCCTENWFKIQAYNASAWQVQRNFFLIPELEES